MPRIRRPKGLILTAIVVFLAVVIVWYVFAHFSKSDKISGEPESNLASITGNSNSGEVVFPVEVAVARRGDLIKRLRTTGIIRANRDVEIIARTAGEIVLVGAQNGEYVKQGDVLVKLDDREARLAMDRASAGLLSAQIEYRALSTSPFVETADSIALGRKKLEVRGRLQEAERRLKEGAIDQEQFSRLRRDYETELAVYDAQRSDVVATKSGLSQAREAYERAKLDLEATEIRAPFSGYIADCDLAIGRRVPAQQTLLKLVDVSRLLVDVEVLESEIGRLRVGRKAEVIVNAFSSERFPGVILRLNPIVDPKSKTVKATVEMKQLSNHLPTAPRPGMFAIVKLESEILPNRLIVPKEALLVRDQRTMVFVAHGGLAKWCYVDVGDEGEKYLEIRSGIDSGDSVIVARHYTLSHDAKIRIENTNR